MYSGPIAVEATFSLQKVRSIDRLPIPTRFSYNRCVNPFAIKVSLLTKPPGAEESEEEVAKEFDRELLFVGLNESAKSDGGVSIWPFESSSPGEFIVLSLLTPGVTSLKIPREQLIWFLQQTEYVVPRGEEGECLDLDGHIQQLFSQS